jgi:hypothetical protein
MAQIQNIAAKIDDKAPPGFLEIKQPLLIMVYTVRV